MGKRNRTKGGKGGQGGPSSGTKQLYWLGAFALALILAVVFLTSGDEDPAGEGSYTPVSSLADIHGLAVDPERSEVLYVATHNGLIRAVNDTDWARVGASQDDYMGFSIHPTNGSIFWVSGHPKSGGNMGVRQSTDGGFTWETLALQGVDFHAMTVSQADPDRLWGSFRGEIHRSLDGGHTWEVVSQSPQPIASFTSHPEDPDVVYAAGSQGIFHSTDAGESWHMWLDRPSPVLAIDPADPDRRFLSTGDQLHRSTDGGETWAPLPLDVGGGTIGYLAVDPSDPKTVYAATYQVGIYKTTDGGDTWTTVRPPSR